MVSESGEREGGVRSEKECEGKGRSKREERERGRSENEERSEIGEVRKWRERCKRERVGVEREREKGSEKRVGREV